jgi:hypothetical protein
LNISFAGKVTDVCITCHTQQIAQLRDNKSNMVFVSLITTSTARSRSAQATHRTREVVADCEMPAHIPPSNLS